MIKGKNAVVTGSTGGIGLGIAEGFAKEGINLVLNGFGVAAEIEKLRAGLAAKFGVKVLYDGADMSKPAEIEAMMKRARAELGGVDILVNNAGIQHVAPGRWSTSMTPSVRISRANASCCRTPR